MTKRANILSALAILTILTGCVREEYVKARVRGGEGQVPERLQVSGIAVIKVDDALVEALEEAAAKGSFKTKSAALDNAFDSLGVTSWHRVFPDAGEFEPRTRKAGLHRWYRIEFADSITYTKAGERLKTVQGIKGTEPVHKVKRTSVAGVPNDPHFKWQWDVYNDKSLNLTIQYYNDQHQIKTYQVNDGADVNVLPIWQKYTTGNSNVIVAVVDDGVQINHPDLNGVVLPGGENGSKNFVARSPYSQYVINPGAHGTHVAGTIAAVRNNGIGVSGIAGGDYANGIAGVRIMSCQIFDGEWGCYDDECAAAIKWGADHGAVISQNSWGNNYDANDDGELDDDEKETAKNDRITNVLRAGIDYFVENAGCDNNGNQLPNSPMKGGLVIFAAGNDGMEYGIPESYDGVIAVGATGPDYIFTWYTNYGDWVDICAPGGDGLGQDSDNPSFINPNVDNLGMSRGNIWNLYCTTKGKDDNYVNYGYMHGTSMACPHVSGVAALLVSLLGRQGFTAVELKERLLEGADATHITPKRYIGPYIDAYGALRHGNIPPEVSDPFPDQVFAVAGESADLTLANHFRDYDEGDELHYSAESSDLSVATASVSGSILRITATGKGVATISVTASDREGISVSTTITIAVTRNSASDDSPLDLSGVTIGKQPITEGLTLTTLVAGKLEVKIVNSTGKTVMSGSYSTSANAPAVVDMKKLSPGRYTVTVKYLGKSSKFVVAKV